MLKRPTLTTMGKCLSGKGAAVTPTRKGPWSARLARLLLMLNLYRGTTWQRYSLRESSRVNGYALRAAVSPGLPPALLERIARQHGPVRNGIKNDRFPSRSPLERHRTVLHLRGSVIHPVLGRNGKRPVLPSGVPGRSVLAGTALVGVPARS